MGNQAASPDQDQTEDWNLDVGYAASASNNSNLQTEPTTSIPKPGVVNARADSVVNIALVQSIDEASFLLRQAKLLLLSSHVCFLAYPHATKLASLSLSFLLQARHLP